MKNIHRDALYNTIKRNLNNLLVGNDWSMTVFPFTSTLRLTFKRDAASNWRKKAHVSPTRKNKVWCFPDIISLWRRWPRMAKKENKDPMRSWGKRCYLYTYLHLISTGLYLCVAKWTLILLNLLFGVADSDKSICQLILNGKYIYWSKIWRRNW